MTALALRDDQTQWDGQQLAALRQTGIDEDISEAELQVFLHECQRRKLDPFSRQIYLIGRWNKARKRKEYRSQTGIDGFRVIARRAADKAGIDYSYEDTIWFDRDGQGHQAWVSPQAPAAAKVVVVRNGQRFDAVARYGAYVQTDSNGNPLGQWREMPDVMTAKCAEALALRKAFPEDLGGIYTEEEMAQADNPQRVQATAEVVRDEPAEDDWPRGTVIRYSSDTPGNGHAQQQEQPDDSWPGVDQAIKDAASFKTEAAGTRQWLAAGKAALDGKCTPKQRDHIQNIINARIHDRRKEAAARILRPLAEDDPWRGKILEELGGDEEARDALAEVQQLVGAGTLGDDRAELLARAIVARFPKAAMAGEPDG